jgi:hypothetical protein
MSYESEHSINIFGKEIAIYNPKAFITTITKTPTIPLDKDQEVFFSGKEVVFVYTKNQYGSEYQKPIFTREYGKSADEFISEFQKINYEYTNQ